MNTSQPQYPHYRYGLAMACIMLLSWAGVPVITKSIVEELSVLNISWARLFFGAIGFFIILRTQKPFSWNKVRSLLPSAGVAGICFAYHYPAYFKAIELSGPGFAQLLIQAGPILLVLIGVVVFHERFSPRQIFGIGVAVWGMYIFNAEMSGTALSLSKYRQATFFVLSSACAWALFATIQKRQLQYVTQIEFLVVSFGIAAFLHSFGLESQQFVQLSAAGWFEIFILVALTISGYWGFGEAMSHMPVSHVSLLASPATIRIP